MFTSLEIFRAKLKHFVTGVKRLGLLEEEEWHF